MCQLCSFPDRLCEVHYEVTMGVPVAAFLMLLLIVSAGRCKPLEGDGELVLVKELRSSRLRRSTESTLRRHLHVQFNVAGERLTLQLARNTDIDTNVPFSFANNKHEKIYVPDEKAVAFCQDITQGAAILAKNKEEQIIQLDGSFHFKGKSYTIQPVDNGAPVSPNGVPHRVTKVKMATDYVEVAKEKHATFKADMNESKMSKGEAKRRQKRDTTVAAYYVEIMFVLDHTIYDYWTARSIDRNDTLSKIKYFYLQKMNAFDMVFRSIDSGASGIMITPVLKEIFIAETREESTWTAGNIVTNGDSVETTVINATVGLEDFAVWTIQDGRSWKNPDYAMLWTRYDVLAGTSATPRGVGKFKGICRGRSAVSVMEEYGQHSWRRGIYMIGLGLGALPDGYNNDCSASDNYVMSTTYTMTEATRANSFLFSGCSVEYFKDFVSGSSDGFPRVCLNNRVCSNGVSTADEDILPGTVYSLDDQCQMFYGENYTYYGDVAAADETICSTLSCVNEQQEVSSTTRGAITGTPCGSIKVRQRVFSTTRGAIT
ncbi:hypothetical protein LSAT2_016875, partial [Lamellibrachia satsuma]